MNITHLDVSRFSVPTDAPEGDGTLTWDSTTLVVVVAQAGGETGLGYTYASQAAGALVTEKLREAVRGLDALDPGRAHQAMINALRNVGVPGAGMMAVSAVDVALWDLKAKLLGVSLSKLLGRTRDVVPAYGSGGFTTYDLPKLQSQLRGWVDAGIPRVKMKIGANPEADLERVRAARDAIGPDAALMVDANGAYDVKQALAFARSFAALGVTWFEEPVSSDDLAGLALLRARTPAGMDIAAGEYGDTPVYFRRMLEAGAVDVLQADATRCGGVTGFLRASSLAKTFGIPFSAHCAPAIHAHLGCAAEAIEHVEYFHDHVRLEAMCFDGVPELRHGALVPDPSRPGHGLALKTADVERFRIA